MNRKTEGQGEGQQQQQVDDTNNTLKAQRG